MILKFDINNREFELLSSMVYEDVGINLTPIKKTLVENRLTSRMIYYGFENFSQYIRLLQMNQSEKINMINLITTNETYFFRESEHFDFLKSHILSDINKYRSKDFRILSAASSIGAEAYSIAMKLHDCLPKLDIVGIDVNSEVVKKARNGLYPLSFHDKIPYEYLKKFCLKGRGSYENKFLINKNILNSVNFYESNLIKFNNEFGMFDVIFLRNVLIYFDNDVKKVVINNLLRCLKKGGLLFLSLTENISSLNIPYLKKIGNSVFCKI
jgi:chemotaxis protein methyltransferase CheR